MSNIRNSIGIPFCFILVLLLIESVSGQELKYIPDQNLRDYFEEKNLLVNDSLDLSKTEGQLRLDIRGRKISNLDGLQFFSKVWYLDITDNNVKSLNTLPPKLRTLKCSGNQIYSIAGLPQSLQEFTGFDNQIEKLPNDLPEGLEMLFLDRNNLKIIENLPSKLKIFTCSDNQISEISSISPSLRKLIVTGNDIQNIRCDFLKQLEFLNYYDNPIEYSDCMRMRQMSCSDPDYNCIPIHYLTHSVLGAENLLLPEVIKELHVKVTSNHSWGLGNEEEEIKYQILYSPRNPRNFDTYTLTDIKVGKGQGKGELLVNSDDYVQKISFDSVFASLESITQLNPTFTIRDQDSIVKYDFEKIIYGNSRVGRSCMDCTSRTITFAIVRLDNVEVVLKFDFYNFGDIEFVVADQSRPINLVKVRDWLFCYHLTQLFFEPSHWLREQVFTFEKAKALEKLIY